MANRTLPVYSTGVVTVVNGQRTVTGSGTQWVATVNGLPESQIAGGDFLRIGNQRPIEIESVDSATGITLVEPWPHGSGTNNAYTIRRHVALPTGAVLAALQTLEITGTDAAPKATFTWEGASARWKFRSAGSGAPELAVGGAGAADGSLITSFRVNPADGSIGIGGDPDSGIRVDARQTLASGNVTVRAMNTSSAGTAGAILTAKTAQASTDVSLLVYNNAASPYWKILPGSAVTYGYLQANNLLIWNTAGTQQNAAFGSSGLHYVLGAAACTLYVQASGGDAATSIVSSGTNPAHVVFSNGGGEKNRLSSDNVGTFSVNYGPSVVQRVIFDGPTGALKPGTDNAYPLGASGARWSVVWAATGTISTSDRRTKTDIRDADLGLSFLERLRPVSYRFRDGGTTVVPEQVGEEMVPVGFDDEGNPVEELRPVMVGREIRSPGKRRHYGLIAQEVRTALDAAGVDDFGGWLLVDKDDPQSQQALRYEQFIPVLIKALQEVSQTVRELRSRVEALETAAP